MKKILTVLILILNLSAYAQGERLFLRITQDAKLATIGDNRGNDAFTPDIKTEFGISLVQDYDAIGYISTGFTYEYADLAGGRYIRWGVQASYTFNKLPIKNLYATTKINWGGITRHDTNVPSTGVDFQLEYKVIEGLKILTIAEFVERNDKVVNYHKPTFTIDYLNTDFSFKVGLEITLKQLNLFKN